MTAGTAPRRAVRDRGIAHGPGDAAWAADVYRAMKELEMRFNTTEKLGETAVDGEASPAGERQ